jgi:predicted RNA-binding protein with PUA-like domain
MTARFWLVKSEPDAFSFQDLVATEDTLWDGVRNFQARNHLKSMQVADRVLYYHSNARPPAVVGIAVVVESAVPDPLQFDTSSKYYDPRATEMSPIWFSPRLAALEPLHPVPLDELRGMHELQRSKLVLPGNRLSVLELSHQEYDAVILRARRGSSR